jgi:acetyl-CoA acetyltransferase family protein
MPIPNSGNLTHWAEQGVLLLNAVLTVRANEPASHAKIGWTKFTDDVIKLLSEKKIGLVFILWGNFAQEKIKLIDGAKHKILKAAFKENGTVTAANASTMNDGAAAIVLMKKEKADKLGLKPIASIIGYADAEQEPAWFTTTPSIAIPIAVEKSNLTMDKIDYWEINEAFSVVGIENSRRLNLDTRKVNVHGGAVSLGHPLGCSGARIIVSLIHILHEYNGTFGAAGICNGGGGASAMVIKKGSFL